MNYYERIQKSIDFIEANLTEDIAIEQCAREAYMSLSGYYRMFLSIAGYTVKEYIRLRRLSLSLSDLTTKPEVSILTLAVEYGYNSADSFTRAFKNQFGILPSKVKSGSQKNTFNLFERMNIMDKYFEIDNPELLEKYPDIKVIRELDDMKVACFTYFGSGPEGNAFEQIKKWMRKNNISPKDSAYRIFGYNNPDPSNAADAEELYGYEVCITIPDSLYDTLEDVPCDFVKGTYDCVKRKILKGGKYAVLSVKRDGSGDIGTNIMHAWERFSKWIDEGKYIWGGRQYLEEHLEFTEDAEHIGGVDLYLPVETAPKIAVTETREETIPSTRVALFRIEGNDGDKLAMQCWNIALTWAKANKLDPETTRTFQYNKGFDRRPPFFHVIMLTLPESFDETKAVSCENVTFTEFSGGKYMTVITDLPHLGNTWSQMEQWRKESGAKAGRHQWVEEWTLNHFEFPYRQIKVCYPIG